MSHILRLHRRLAVLMGIAGLLAFVGGAGVEPVAAALAGGALLLALFWQPAHGLGARLEWIWMAAAALLVLRALYHGVVVADDVVVPVVDLLLLLLCAEALRPLDARHDTRLYALSFALLLASTAYRPGILFAVAFVAYVALATVALMLGHLRREAERHRIRELRIGRRFLSATAALSGITLAMSAVVFLAFPRVSRGWMGRGTPFATTIAGFSDDVSLAEHGALIYANPEIVLRVEFADGRTVSTQRLHWRGRAYDHFDGVRWSRSRGLPRSAPSPSWYARRWPGPVRSYEVYAAPLDVRVLFTLHPVVSLETRAAVRIVQDNAGDLAYFGSTAPVYVTYTPMGTPEPAVLRALSEGPAPAETFFLQLPPLPERVWRLADSLAASATTRYDRVRAVEDWLQAEFRYTLDLPDSPEEATLEHFLFERREGHCAYFSTAMVVLLRAMGIPARNVNGFLGGDWNEFGNYLAVTQNDAHSWVEVWFPQIGWVPFDPTPAGAGVGARATAWFWPGRFLLDGLQHRWNKWVLDYSLQKQVGLFRRTADLFSRPAAEPGGRGGRATAPRLGRRLALALGVLALVLLLRIALRSGHARASSETRLYLKLRRAYERAGFEPVAACGPVQFVEALRAAGAPGADRAAEVVAFYLRARFAGEEIGEIGRRRMVRALAAAGRSLRAARRAAA
ncbi:MAG: DUF3488 domain-containing protein [Gemmatimonadetes bacterium]|nr:DUF3488 domain-containing protein [Gemmatimonadota bacterium]